MFHTIEIISILLVALALAPALAHLLEFPGKKRLTKEGYLTVQPIYYPIYYQGFTIAGGISEVGGLISVLVVLLLTQRGAPVFWLRLLALLAMAGMEIIFWVFTQPVNKFWLHDTHHDKFGSVFFEAGPGSHRLRSDDPEGWKKLRDRWEDSRIARAGLVALSFLLLVMGAVTQV